MANFVLLVDPNPERRRRFTATVEPELPLVEGLSSCRCESGDFCCLWAAPERSACSHRADENGAAVVWGEPIEGDSDKRIDAEQLASRWNHQEAKTIEAFDGFHASCLYHPQRGLTVGSDILGLFPIYYYGDDEVLLVGSSPELFRHHPAFRPQLNPPALISILLLGHPLEGETLWQDVRRLEARNVLRWQAGKKPKGPPQVVRWPQGSPPRLWAAEIVSQPVGADGARPTSNSCVKVWSPTVIVMV